MMMRLASSSLPTLNGVKSVGLAMCLTHNVVQERLEQLSLEHAARSVYDYIRSIVTAFKPGLTVRAIRPVIAGLEALGHSVDSLLAEAGIPASILADLDGYLPAGSSRKLWERAAAIAKDDNLGIHVAMAAPVNAFDVHAYAMLSSPTLSGALNRVCRYQRLINEGTELTLDDDAGGGVLRHGLLGGGAVSRQPAEFLAVTWLRLGRMVTGTAWSPVQVFFAHDPPADTRPHEEIFGVRPNFASGFTAMRIPAATLALTNPRADATLAALLDRYTSTLLDTRPTLTTVSGRVRGWLVESHGSGVPLARDAARALAMSERTLHRRLADEQTTFRELLDRFRHEKAVELLTTRRHGIAEVAFLLGYSEMTAFYRAFKRWTGRSPAQVRERALSD